MSGPAQSANTQNNLGKFPVSDSAQGASEGGSKPRGQTSLGRWTLLKPLARGGMGEVYLASSGGIEGAERPAVVKIIRREHAQDKSFLARFFDEARIQAQLQHPGVAQVLEASTDQSGKPYVVLEYIEGRNLSDVRQRAAQLNVSVSWADAVALSIPLAEALAHVHERTDHNGKALDIVHRDLSPQNVMIGYAGDAKLIDFGTARGENRRCQTVSGIVFAKPGYVAPEVANQNQPGPQADLYALGIILWELVMGRRFLTGDPTDHLGRVAAGQRNPPAVSLTNNVPLELDTVIARLTAPRLQDRYQTAREAVTALGRVLSRAPSLADGERSVRGRIAHLMSRLYPAEPTKTRAEFARLLIQHRRTEQVPASTLPESPKPSAEAEASLAGTRYRIERELSKSAMSVVYEAIHIDLGRRVALKVLPREHCESARFEAQFRQEARALAQLRHESMVTLHDFGVSQDGRPYYAMELLSGETLRNRADAGTVDWRKVLRIGIDVCEALQVAHSRGIIHRDIKPANIFLTNAGETKLIDFGIAQGDHEPEQENESGTMRLSGTPEYMAPEQMSPGEVDERADIFALAAVLYELLVGTLPHVAEGTLALREAKQREPVIPPRRARPGTSLPHQVDTVLLKALSAAPGERYLNATLFGRALDDCLHAPSRMRRRRRQIAASAMAALSFAAGFAFYQNVDDDQLRQLVNSVPRWLSPSGISEAAPANQDVTVGAAETRVDSERVTASPPVTDSPPEAAREDGEVPGPDETASSEEDDADQSPPRVAENEPGASETDSETDAAPAAGSTTATTRDLPAEVREQMAKADALMTSNQAARETALAIYRELGQKYEVPAVLSGWSRAAGRAKWWGESLRIAMRWAAQDAGAEAQLHLARTQRLVGQRFGAIQTLERLLERVPAHQEATAMLARYREL